jgi:hypothetical protein
MLFTHTNPVAYGIDRGFVDSLGPATIAFPEATDWAYLNLLLRQVSVDTFNRHRVAPYLGSMAWVARWVADLPDQPAPVMSRGLYREALRHLWLRGVDAMAVFNPAQPGDAAYQLAEVQDAAAVYGEMLAYARLLTEGEAFGLEVPPIDRKVPFWSGVRDTSQALVRVYNPSSAIEEIRLEPWPGRRVVLEAPPGGTNFLLHREGEGIPRAEAMHTEPGD